ncbi:uncharacterized protein LOC134803076 [Cydia splendana]|uniref:uncharacterized protein LOC134803076 n=1 Tax=Cydia splendana TaxID=1100963 RepID=UPI00300C968F
MELKTFGEDDFDPKKWINRAWSSSGNQEKEVFVANTVSRLQLYMKQLTNSLDETTTQIVNSIPRTLQDAAALQLEGALLQQKLLSLEEKVEGVEEQTGHSILSLQRIDQLKSRLENAASALREADKWAALATALEDVLESGVPNKPEELEALAGQVTALTHSLEVLTEASDYESKRLQLEALYNRLEAALSAPFLTALDQGDKERTACYVSLFRGMNRASSAARCWRRSVCASLATQWRRSAGQPSPRVAALAGKGEAHTHVEWLTNVLKSETPYAELVRLYTDLLHSLDPSPAKVVSASLKLCSDPEEGILLLTELRRDIDEFLVSIRAVIDGPAKNKEVVPTSTLQELGVAAYAPLKALLPKYTDLQRQVFLAYLEGPQLRQDDILEQSRAILTVSERCEGWLDAAYGKAKKIAGDAAWPHYAPTVEAFFTALCGLISSHSRRIEQEFHTSRGGVLSAACPAAVTLERAAAQALEAAGKPQTYDSGRYLAHAIILRGLISSHSRRIEQEFHTSRGGVLSAACPAAVTLERAAAQALEAAGKPQTYDSGRYLAHAIILRGLISSHSRRIEQEFHTSRGGVLSAACPAAVTLERAAAQALEAAGKPQTYDSGRYLAHAIILRGLISSHSRRIEQEFHTSRGGVLSAACPAAVTLERAAAQALEAAGKPQTYDSGRYLAHAIILRGLISSHSRRIEQEFHTSRGGVLSAACPAAVTLEQAAAQALEAAGKPQTYDSGRYLAHAIILRGLISSHSRRIEQEFHTSRGGVLSAACPAAVTLERAAAQALEAAGKPQTYDSGRYLAHAIILRGLISSHSRRIEQEFHTSRGGVLSAACPAAVTLEQAAAQALEAAGKPQTYDSGRYLAHAIILRGLISSHSRRIEQEFHTSRGGVLSAACPAAVTLERAAAQALEAAGKPQTYDSEQPTHALTDLPALLLDADVRCNLAARRAEPPGALSALRRAAARLRALARDIVRGPVDAQLDKIPSLNVWSDNDALSTDLPDFSLSPQEYITEIGQYLMTLPQHLEMHLSEKQAPWQFLSEICTHTCEVYAEKILNIRNMDALGTKRCLTDIVYLSSVVEDLGTAVTPSLKNLERSLRAATPQHE